MQPNALGGYRYPSGKLTKEEEEHQDKDQTQLCSRSPAPGLEQGRWNDRATPARAGPG